MKKGFVTEAEDLAPYVTERTKALILNSPNNPNGLHLEPRAVGGHREAGGGEGLWASSPTKSMKS